jgi:hypothetical protein
VVSAADRRAFVLRENWRENVYQGRREGARFFESQEWRELRDRVIARDRHECQRCGKRRRRELTAHHIMPRAEGGADVPANLLCLCRRCHDIVEADETLRTRALIEGSGPWGRDLVGVEEARRPNEIEDGRPSWHAWVYGGARAPRGRMLSTEEGDDGAKPSAG